MATVQGQSGAGAKTGSEQANQNGCNMGAVLGGLAVVVLIIIIFVIAGMHWDCSNRGVSPCSHSCPICGVTTSGFANIEEKIKEKMQDALQESNYNPLYTSDESNVNGHFLYTQPMGDTSAMKYGRAGQGTSGSFLPLQGGGAQVYMANSDNTNRMIPAMEPGKIGGQGNYTDRMFTAYMNGFNNFGYPFNNNASAVLDSDYSNSYLIEGSNTRVRNPGQPQSGNADLPCATWWPRVSGANCSDSNTDLRECSVSNIEGCVKFIEGKDTPEWVKVVEASGKKAIRDITEAFKPKGKSSKKR